MSPEKTWFVPQDQEAAAEEAMTAIGARLIKSRDVVEDHPSELEEYFAQYRELVAQLTQPHTPQVEANIAQGYRGLLTDIFESHSTTPTPRIPSVELSQIQQVTSQIFLDCTQQQPRKVTNGKPVWDTKLFNPRQAETIIYRYGLINGQRLTYRETGERIGKSPSEGRDLVTEGTSALLRTIYSHEGYGKQLATLLYGQTLRQLADKMLFQVGENYAVDILASFSALREQPNQPKQL
ncbi:MAG TPA: hypothetical protein VLF68_01240 [Candidatus Saccharimonadales bacterium]|nr:hypothetical protein [Candidatus Saccharimonadales bacterium]